MWMLHLKRKHFSIILTTAKVTDVPVASLIHEFILIHSCSRSLQKVISCIIILTMTPPIIEVAIEKACHETVHKGLVGAGVLGGVFYDKQASAC